MTDPATTRFMPDENKFKIYISALTSDYKKDRIDKIFESGGKVKEWQLSPNYVNSILREGDGIEKGDCNDTTYNIEINFAGVSENMELQINTD